MKPNLTVLFATRNRATVLERTLDAMGRVRRSGLSVNFVIVDNGSTDGTADVLERFAPLLPLTRLYEPTAGKCHALNRALRSATLGDIVVFTDDDVTPCESWLEEIVAVCGRWPEHAVFGGRIDPEWPSGVPIPGWAHSKQLQAIAFSAHQLGEREREYPAELEPFGPNYWVRRSMLLGMTFLDSIGPHPTRRTLGDETHFLRQLRARGACPIYAPAPRVGHRIEVERTTRASIYRRAYQYGRGCAHTAGGLAMARSGARSERRARTVAGIVRATFALAGAALERDDDLRLGKVFSGLFLLGRSVEALRLSVRRLATAASGSAAATAEMHSEPTSPPSAIPRHDV